MSLCQIFCEECHVVDWIFSSFFSFQHEASRAAFEDALKKIDSITERIENKSAIIEKTQNDIEKHKHEASEAHGVEKVCALLILLNCSFICSVNML